MLRSFVFFVVFAGVVVEALVREVFVVAVDYVLVVLLVAVVFVVYLL